MSDNLVYMYIFLSSSPGVGDHRLRGLLDLLRKQTVFS